MSTTRIDVQKLPPSIKKGPPTVKHLSNDDIPGTDRNGQYETILMKKSESTSERILLRSSTLTLSKYDEKMPRKSSVLTPNRHAHSLRSSGHFSFDDHRHIPRHHSSHSRRGSELTRDLWWNSDAKNKSLTTDEVDIEPVMSAGAGSILTELVKRKKKSLAILLVIFIILFVTGCVIASLSFAFPTANDSAVGKAAGFVLLAIGLCACVFIVYLMMKPDKELMEKIERREKLFSTFQKIAEETNNVGSTAALAKVNESGDTKW